MTFTSCKDYDDDISGVRDTANQNESAISALQTQLTTLQTAATTAQTAADAAKTAAAEAKTAADAAKAAGDEAKADAATAKAKAEEAIAAAAQAKADAITEAKAEVAALKTLMESELAGKLDESVFDAALLVLNAKIEGIEDGLSTLGEQVDGIDGRVVENTAAIRTAEEAITALIAADTDLQLQLDALTLYAEATKELADNNAEDIEAAQEDILAAQEDILAAQEEIADLWVQLTADKAELQGLIDGNTSAIALLAADLEATNQSIEDLKEAIEDELDAIKADITGIQGDIADINTQILAINGNLASLHTLIVNRLTAITRASNAYVDGIEAIIFNSLKYKPMDAGENALIPSTGYNYSTAAPAIASYKFNPRSFNLANADYNYVDRTATIISTGLRSADSNWVEIEGAPVKNAADGTVNFTLHRLNAHDTQPASGKGNVIALEATLKGDAVDQGETGVVIAAEQELVYDNILDANNVRIADKATLTTDGVDAHYPVTFADAVAGTIWYEDMTYDKIYDLKAKVATCANDGNTHAEFDIDAYNLKYKFSVASTAYNIETGSTTTNQQTWIELVDGDAGTFKAEDFNKEAIGRTPILKVELVDEAGNVVRRAFVKVKIGSKKADDMTVGTIHDLVYKCNNTAASFTINELYIRENVYRVITSGKETSLSHEEFWNLYESYNAVVKKNNEVVAGFTAPQIVDGDAGTATKKIVWNFTHGEIGEVGSIDGSQLIGSVTVKNKLVSSEFPAYVTFQFTVNVKLPDITLPSANKVENDVYWLKNEDGSYYAYNVNINVPETTQSPANQAQFRTSLPQAYSTYTVSNPTEACTTSYFKVVATFADGSETQNVLSGVDIDGDDIRLKKTGPGSNAVKEALNSAGGLQAQVAHIYVLENGEEITVNSFLVNFVRPVNLNMPDGVTVVDAKTGGDIADFQWNGILTDWRGEAIVSPEWNRVERSSSFWRPVYTPEYEWVDGRYIEETPAHLDIEKDTVSFVVGSVPVEVFAGSATYQVQRRRSLNHGNWTSWNDYESQQTYETADPMESVDMVTNWLNAKKAELLADHPAGWDGNKWYEYRVVQVGQTQITSETITTGQPITYIYVKNVTYVPATYRWKEGQFVSKPYTPEPRPAYEGTTEGQLSNNGQWEWTVWTWNVWDWTPGQYWNYYGPFGNITVDFDNVTTNLTYNGGQLPSSVTLEQVGNTVKYVNVGAPVGDSYEIYIPATVTYGWGTASTVLTITVNPVN